MLSAAIVLTMSAQLGFACADEMNSKVSPMHDGRVIAPDTPDEWWEHTTVVDLGVRHELSGAKPPGGQASWDQHWLGMIQAIEDSQENYEKYVRYIVDTRRKLGLPDLPGYSRETPKESRH